MRTDHHYHDDNECCECDNPDHCCCQCPVFLVSTERLPDDSLATWYAGETGGL